MTTENITSGSGNWTCPYGVTSVSVVVIGGGGGGVSTSGLDAGGGGGGGGYSVSGSYPVTAGNSYSYVVGDGGAAGVGGGTSSWDGLIVANGGSAGSGLTGGVSGSGSTANGGNGGSGGNNGTDGGGGGGSAGFGFGGNAGGNNFNSTGGAGGTGGGDSGSGGNGGDYDNPGLPGSAAGGGGGGASATASSQSGGVGSNGLIKLTYTLPTPLVYQVYPSGGLIAGGTSVTVLGANFTTGATVTFDGVSATSVSVVNDTQITCNTPAHAVGLVTVAVVNTDANGSQPNVFAYYSSSTGGPVGNNMGGGFCN